MERRRGMELFAWERMIASTKRFLRKTVGGASLSFKEMRTVSIEIEGTLNNRPLTYLYDDEQGISYPLTPSSLIYGRAIAITPNDKQLKSVAHTKLLLKDKNIQSKNVPQQVN